MTTVTASHPNQIAEQLTGRNYVSYSALSTYRQCSLRYAFKYVEGLPEETVSASLVFGGAIHRSIERHYNELLIGKPAPDLETLLAAYHGAWEEQDRARVVFAKDADRDTLGGLAERTLRAFQASDAAKPAGTIIGVEEEFRGPFAAGCPDLLARVDLLTDTGQSLVIADLKTARSRWSHAKAFDAAEQLLLYRELVGGILPNRSVRLEFIVVTKGKEPVVDRLPVAVDWRRAARTRRIAQRVWRAIEAQHFYPSPSPMSCPTCPFRAPCRAWGG